MILAATERLSDRARLWLCLFILNTPQLLIWTNPLVNNGAGPASFPLVWYSILSRLVHWGGPLALALVVGHFSANQLWIRHQSAAKVTGLAILWWIVIFAALLPFSIIRMEFLGLHEEAGIGAKSFMASNLQLPHSPIHGILSYGCLAVVVGLIEEMWRAGMLAGLFNLFPAAAESRGKTLGLITIVGIIFGAGHLNQGVPHAIYAGLLGIGFGAIMVFRKSYWEAAATHALLDASVWLIAGLRVING